MFRWKFPVTNDDSQISPFRPCFCQSALHVFAGSSYSVYSCRLHCWVVDRFCFQVGLLHPDRLSVPSCLCLYSVFTPLTFTVQPSLLRTVSLVYSVIPPPGSHHTRSSANSIAQGFPASISSVITSIFVTNNSELSAEPWWSPT